MTSTKPPNGPGSRRALPEHATAEHARRLRELLGQDKRWVLRCDWERYLDHRVSVDDGASLRKLTRDQRVAAWSWLSQQRHGLHAIVEGGAIAPEGWLESWALTQALTAELPD